MNYWWKITYTRAREHGEGTYWDIGRCIADTPEKAIEDFRSSHFPVVDILSVVREEAVV